MAQPIIIDDFRRQLRAQAAAAPYQFAGQALQNVTQGIEQVLFDAQQRKEREKEERLAVMAQMAGKYGFKKLGPDFAANWERDSGVKFPRNPDGTVNIPQSHEEEVTAHHDAFVQAHPELEGVDLGLMKPPMTPDEKHYKDQELSLDHERNMIEERYHSLEIGLRRAQLMKDDGPSGFAYNKQTGKLDYVGYEDPKKSLSNRQLAGATDVIKANQSQLEDKLKKWQILASINKIKQNDKLSKMVDPALKTYLNPKAKKEDRQRALVVLNSIRGIGGPDLEIPPEKDGGWWSSFSLSWPHGGTQPASGDLAHQLSPDEERDRAAKEMGLTP